MVLELSPPPLFFSFLLGAFLFFGFPVAFSLTFTGLFFGTIGVALGLTILHLSVTFAQGGLERSQLVYRPTVIIATGFAVSGTSSGTGS